MIIFNCKWDTAPGGLIGKWSLFRPSVFETLHKDSSLQVLHYFELDPFNFMVDLIIKSTFWHAFM
jgi:hypothetical protein